MQRSLIFCAGALILAPTALVAEPAVVNLKAEALAQGAYVRALEILDVAEDADALRAKLAHIFLGPSPEGEAVRVIERGFVQGRLSLACIPARVTGPLQVTVKRGAAPQPAAAPDVESLRLELERRLRAHLAIGQPDRDLKIEQAAIVGARPRDLGEATSFRIVQGPDFEGRAEVLGWGADADGVPYRAEFRVLLAARHQVVKARRLLQAGDRIGPEDVELAPPTDKREDSGLQAIDDAVGLSAKRLIRRGEAIAPTDLRRQPAVRRGAHVSVQIGASGFVLRDTAVAQEDGALGEVITVMNPRTRKPYRVRLTGPDQGTPEVQP